MELTAPLRHWLHLAGPLLLAASGLCFAQEGQDVGSPDVFLPPDHQLRRQLEDARDAISKEEYNDAVKLLGSLLTGNQADDPTAALENAEDFFIEPAVEGSARRSLKAEAWRLIAGLPKGGLESYELLYGHQAEVMLSEALVKGDIEGIVEVTRMYFHTPAGHHAAMLLGRHHLSQGRPLAAALALKQLRDLPASSQHEPELSLLLATSWLLADMPDQATEVLSKLREKHPTAKLIIGGKELKLADGEADALAWLKKTLGEIKPLGGTAADQWLMFRGNAARNAPARGGSPIGQVRWAVPTPNDLKQQQAIAEAQRQYVKLQTPALPGLHPLVVRHPAPDNSGERQEIVLTRAADRLLAVDFHSGERIWFYPPWSGEPANTESSSFSVPTSGGDSPQMLKLKQRTWQDAPYGQMSTDGTNLYFVHDLGLADKAGPEMIVAGGGFIRQNPDRPKSFNQLVSLELAREGYQLWSVGDEDGGDEPRLAGAFFLGPPLPLLDRLFVLAELNGDIRLVVLEPTTGKLVWQQQLCGVDNQAILDDWSRRLGGATPSFGDGVLICPTSAGAVVAVDVAKRSLLWGYQYLEMPKNAQPSGAFFPSSVSISRKPIGECWADSSVTITGDKVLITPVEHDEILCLSLLEGTVEDKPLWRRARGDGLYVACVHEGKAVIVGKSEVLAVKLEDGEVAWKTAVPDSPSTMPSGRGFESDGHYFLPLSSSELVKIDLDTGRLVEVTPTRGILGNLICYQDTVISQGTTELSTFYQREALASVVAQRLAKDPADAWALARQAELLLKEGKQTDALEALRRSHQLEPDDSTKALLVDTLLALLEADFANNQKLADEADTLIDRPDQRAAFLRLMAVGSQALGKRSEAFNYYLKIIDQPEPGASAGLGGTEADGMQRVEEHLQVRHARWIHAQLAKLWIEAQPEERKAIDAAARERLASALEEGSITSLRRFLEFFGTHPAADEARLALAARLNSGGELLEAELIFVDLLEANDPTMVAKATAQLARLLKEAGHIEEAAILYRRLNAELADVDCGDGKTGRQMVADLPLDSAIARAVAGGTSWPQGRVAAKEYGDEEGPKLGYSSYQKVYPSDLREIRGSLPAGMRLVLDQPRRVIMRDGLGRADLSIQLNGSETSRQYRSNYSLTQARVTGHLVVLSVGYELFALDFLRNSSSGGQRVLWRQELSATPVSEGQPGPQHAVPKLYGNPWGGHRYEAADSQGRPITSFTAASQTGVCLRRSEQLLCVDALRPDVVHWVRDGVANGAEVFGDGQVLLLMNPGEFKATVLSALDGSQLGECEVGLEEGRWLTMGRRMLRWDKLDEGARVSLFDPWDAAAGKPRENPVVWSHDFSADAKGALIENDQVAVLQADGALKIIELATGKFVVEAALEREAELTSLHVLRGQDEYIVVTNSPPGEPPGGISVQPAPGGYGALGQSSPLVKGNVYAIDRASGEPRWSVPARVEHFGLPLDQAPQLPVFTVLRNVSPDNNSPTRTWKTEVVCLDKRDGRTVFHEREIPGQTQVYHLDSDPQKNIVNVLLPGKSYALSFTEEPRPPEPPAQLGASPEEP